MRLRKFKSALTILFVVCAAQARGQTARKVIIDQDGRGPATTDQQSILVFLQSPGVETLGITIVSGDQWRDEEVAHTLRLLEFVGRRDIPVVPGAVFPLINRREFIQRWEKLYGKVTYQGAWNDHKAGKHNGAWNTGKYHEPYEVPPLVEGNPTTKPAEEDAAHFITRILHKYPHEVTIYAGGPLTNIAQAVSIDPQVPDLAKELVVMGGSIAPQAQIEQATTNRREFNFWWDPEAAHMALTAPWHKITVTSVDISIKTRLTPEMIKELGKSAAPAAQYIAEYGDEEYMWDELAAAAWVDPAIITKETQLFIDVDFSHGPGYGNTLVWLPGSEPGLGEQVVHVQQELDLEKLNRMFMELMVRPTPGSSNPAKLIPLPAKASAGHDKWN